jgi:two-component system, NtrC family, sensor histidine kinase HydH
LNRLVKNFLRAQDFVWLLLFAALVAFGLEETSVMITLLLPLAAFQILEPRIAFFQTARGMILSPVIKLILGCVLIAYTHGVASSYYFILLLPVVSAATSLGFAGTAIFIALSCAAYLSFLFELDWQTNYIPPDQVKELLLRVTLLPVVGFLTHQLAEANRVRAKNYQAVAEQLADANRHLQEAEESVRRADRLAALGQLTAGLAHELRNPMSTIKNSAEMLGKSVPESNALGRELAGYISSEVDRTNSLITRFLEFARPLRLRFEVTDVTTVIDRAVLQLERQKIQDGVTVYKNYSPDVRPVPLDGELMERVIFNLLLNAAQASPPKSAVTVKTKMVGDNVEVSVIDRGVGIDPKHIENIFNPFFTTKNDGVGLGLAIVSKIIDEHQGRIVVESQLGEGSVFRIDLPLRQRPE